MPQGRIEPRPPHMRSVPVVREDKAADIQEKIALIIEGSGRLAEGHVRGRGHG